MFHVKHSPLSRRWPSRSATHRLLRRRSEPLARELVAEHNDSAFWLHAFAFAVHTWHRCNRIVDDLPFERRHWNEFLAVTVSATRRATSSASAANSSRRRRRHLAMSSINRLRTPVF